MVCVLFNLNKYWAKYYKKHFFKKFYTVLIRAPKFISGTCIVVAHIHVIEFQKYGLSHSHILIIPNNKIKTVEDYNSIVSTEISDKNIYLTSYDTIRRTI